MSAGKILLLGVLLCLPRLTLGLPLYPGARWTYNRTGAPPHSGFCAEMISSLHVLDSVRVGSSLQWNLMLRDSIIPGTPECNTPAAVGIIRENAFQIAEQADGKQAWSLNPVLSGRVGPEIPWPPTPPLEGGLWDNDLGWVAAGAWTLLEHDGKPVPPPWGLRIPETGSSWIWRQTMVTGTSRFGGSWQRDTTTTLIQWKLQERLEDSAGWKRTQILETRIPGGDSLRQCRFHLVTRKTRGCIAPERFEADWWGYPGERFDADGYRRTSTTSRSSYLVQFGMSETRIQSSRVVDSAGTAHLLTAFAETCWPESRGGPVTCNDKTITTVLTERNGVAGVTRSVHREGIGALRRSAERYPATEIRWRDLRGRGGSFPAAALESVLERRDVGLLFVEARFPDGTRWSGRVR